MVKCDYGHVEFSGEAKLILAELSTLIAAIREELKKNCDNPRLVDDLMTFSVEQGFHDFTEEEKQKAREGLKAVEELLETLKKIREEF